LPSELTRFPVAGGQPLSPAVRQKMEAFFGANFSDVRIHVGAQATAIGATAFTQGSHIHFAPGQYDPITLRGQQILGHELTHVVQQRAGRVRNPFGSGTVVVHEAALEAEAERMGRRVAAENSRAVRPAGNVFPMRQPHAVQARFGNGGPVQLLKRMNQVVSVADRLSPRAALYRYIAYLAGAAKDLVADQKLADRKDADEVAYQSAAVQRDLMGIEGRIRALADDKLTAAVISDERDNMDTARRALEALIPGEGDAGPPALAGYTAVTRFNQTVYLKDGKIELDEVGLTHLVQGGAMGVRGQGGFHTSEKISGATSKDFYLHPSKAISTLYLLESKGTHAGIPMFAIKKTGQVSSDHHSF